MTTKETGLGMDESGAEVHGDRGGSTQGREVKGAAAVSTLTTAEQLRELSTTQLPAGERSQVEVDALLARAAQTVEGLLAEVRASRGEIARLQAALERGEQAEAVERSPEEIVGDVLVTAHQAAERVLEKAQHDATWTVAEARRGTVPILADAQRTLEEAGRLHRDAQAAFAQARLQADAIVQSAHAERERVIADTAAEAKRRRAELELDNMRLETAIKGLRSEWAGRAAEALARLDGIGLEAGSGPGDRSEDTADDGSEPGPAQAVDPHEGEVVDELQARILDAGSDQNVAEQDW